MERNLKDLSALIVDALRTKGMSVEKLSQATGISERYLSFLVEGQLDRLPAVPYFHGYIMKVAAVLGLDGEQLWAEYVRDRDVIRRSGHGDTLPRNRFATTRFTKRHAAAAAIALIVLLYAATRISSVLERPELTLANLPDNLVVNHPTLSVSGTVRPGDQLTLNREIIYPDKSGHFELTRTLEPGFNTLDFRVRRFLGREGRVARQVFYQQLGDKTSTTTPAD